ncbi:MAG: LysR family transcriptional regulator [Solobacterium sp.]|nr:LysR family transcriptional regulator [Solobacterium sp.]
MDIRIMEYFLAVVREGTISGAANAVHVSQPALSRQMRELEEELGVTLFERGSRRIALTEEGMILRRRCEEIVRLVHQTEREVSEVRKNISGDIYFGAGESHVFHYISKTAASIIAEYPGIRFHVVSGDTKDLLEDLENGLIDLALIFSDFDRSSYHSIQLPAGDSLGILMRSNDPLADRVSLNIDELRGLPIFTSRTSMPYIDQSIFRDLNLIGTYNLIYNASLLVEDGAGYALCFDHLIDTEGSRNLYFRPVNGSAAVEGSVIWKKYQVFSPVIQLFIDRLRETVVNEKSADKF